ncbi:MAG: glycerate kinase [Lachnospiraceae bacterium]|nr:glycerate kinase [Lachnospiraceae bacterium]
MKIVIAPDSFKGSLSAPEVARAMERGVKRIFPAAETVLLPMADGGEGTVDALVTAMGGRLVTVPAHDPLGREINASYGILPDNTAVIETAAASGLTLIEKEKRDALHASTFGTGELIRDALKNGAKKLIIGLGGSATTDGGMGIAKAMGFKFLDEKGAELNEGGAELKKLSRIDRSGVIPETKEAVFQLASDVKNTLYGKNGAACVFAPQKGASAGDVALLDAALKNYGDVLLKQTCRDIANLEGTGAAGGIASVFLAFLNASLGSGIDFVLDVTDFDSKVKDADLVITGEGRIDAQSACGKVPYGVAKRTKRHGNIPVIAIGGSLGDGYEELYSVGVDAIASCVNKICTLEEAMKEAAANVEQASANAMKFVLIPRK